METLFSVKVTEQELNSFAQLSGDWNPLHTDKNYASNTTYGGNILHGAFSSALISRVAGMYLPGKYCLLHRMNLRFLSPITVPATLVVKAKEKSKGWVEVEIINADSGVLHVQASYSYGLHRELIKNNKKQLSNTTKEVDKKIVIIGATGGIGSALLNELGDRAVGTSRRKKDGYIFVDNIEDISHHMESIEIESIIYCAWPMPDNEPITSENSPEQRVERFISEPLRQMMALARLLKDKGDKNSTIVLIGSTFSDPGRHGYQMPLYTLGKSLIPTLVKILAVELGSVNKKSLGIVFDVIDAGMNSNLTEFSRLQHADRTPSGILPNANDAAKQIIWALDNKSSLLSGATINLSGGSLP